MAAKEEVIASWFYFTGGTALTYFYLQHRLSDDLDFFSEDEFDHFIVDDFINKVCEKLQAKSEKRTILGHAIFTLIFPDKKNYKIDFVYQPFKRLESGKKYHLMAVNSLWDIVIDKLYTIFHRSNARDFVDLYFGITEVGCDLNQLINGLQEKYQTEFSKIDLLSRLPIVKDLTDFPKMIKPFDKKAMEEFFLKLVRQGEKEIFK